MGWLDSFRSFLADAWAPVDAPADPASAPLREAVYSSGYDPDALLSATGGGSRFYRPLSKQVRDPDPITDKRARDLAYALYEYNPLAKRIIELTRDWVLGEGVSIRVEPDRDSKRGERRQTERQEIIDRFWTDPHNKLDETIFTKVLELCLWGEQCYPVTVNSANGAVRLGYIDPSQIARIIPDPLDATCIHAVELLSETGKDAPRFKVIACHDDPAGGDTYGRLVGVLPTDRYTVNGVQHEYAGACFWFAINKVTGATRGRSDLLCVLDWLDAIDQLHMSEVDRAILMKSFIWDVTMTGLTTAQVQARLAEIGTPAPGSVRGHNEREIWTAVSPQLNSFEHRDVVDVLLNHVAAGAGHPKTWMAATMDVNRATAQELGEPSFKRMTARQRQIKHMLEHMGQFVLDQAELAGRIGRRASRPGMLPDAWPLKAIMPEIRSRDMQTAAETISSAANGLVQMVDNGFLDQATAQEVCSVLVNEVGVEVNLDQMREAIKAEEAERKAKALEIAQQTAQQPGAKPGSPPVAAPRPGPRALAAGD